MHGFIRDSEGHPIAQAIVELRKTDSHDNLQTQTDTQGSYRFAKVPDGVYHLYATKHGYAGAEIPSLFLKPAEAKAIDLTIKVQAGQLPSSSAPQFSDEPQFTVAGVTDTSNLGGHGPDTVVRTRDSLAKETLSLGESSHSPALDQSREALLRDAAESDPPDFAANHQLGHLLLASGRAREAIPYLERAASKDQENYENAYDLANANAQAGNYSKAREELTTLLARKDDADLHHLLADVDEKLGDSLAAVRNYQRAAELAPSETHLFDWGAELLLHHAPEPAIAVFSKANALFPSSSRIVLGLGAAYFARGAYDEAVFRICQASDLNPSDPAPYRFLGNIEQAQNAPSSQVIEKLHRFVLLQPKNAEANYYYALGLWKLHKATPGKQNPGEVESLLKTAIQIDPGYAAAELQLGVLYSEQEEYPLAIAHFQKALAIDPQLEEGHYRLAQVYRQKGDSDKAKEELRLYRQLAKESAQKQERERHEIKQFVYTLRDHTPPQAQ